MEPPPAARPRAIRIPYRGPSDVEAKTVTIPVSKLPADPSAVLKVLRGSTGPLRLWLDVAVEYYRQGNDSAFISVLNEGCDESKENVDGVLSSSSDNIAFMDMLNALAGYYITKAAEDRDEKRRQALLQTANHLASRAYAKDDNYDMNWVMRGLHFLTSGGHGSFAHAQQALENALSIDENNFPAILCQALMAYRRSDWVLARKLYIRALRIHPNCSAAVRVGLGMCLFKLGHVKAAKMAMERALELQPDNADALGALAVLERYHWAAGHGQDPREAEIAAVRSAMALANKGYNAAVQADRVHPVIWNQWAHFYFKKWARLPAAAAVTQGSPVVRVDRDVTALVKEGHPIYVAQTAVYTVASATRTQITLTKPYEAESATGVRLDHRQFDKSMKLATEALGATSNNETLAESNYIIGRCYHAQGDYNSAHVWYSRAISKHPTFALALYGVAQTLLKQRRFKDALDRIREVLKLQPDNVDALKIAAGAYMQLQEPNMEEAVAQLRRAVDLRRNDVDALIQLALLHQRKPDSASQLAALNAYKDAYKALERSGRPKPPQLLANIATLLHRLGDTTAAMARYKQALEVMARAEGHKREEFMFTAKCVTTTMNMALLCEQLGDHAEADRLYTAILKEHPNYVQCYVRKGAMLHSLGRLGDAEQWLKRGVSMVGKQMTRSTEALAMLAKVYYDMGNMSAAASTYKKLCAVEEQKKSSSRRGAVLSEYGRVALANLDMEDGELDRRSLESVNRKYLKVLRAHPRSIYAANGFATTLAKYNILDQAKAAFEGIQEEAGNVPDVMLNLAHTLLQMNEHEQAVQLYRKVLETCTPFNRQVQVMMMLARALYERAITKAVEVNDVDRTAAIRDCIATLRKAIHLCPADPVIRFNLGVVLSDTAVGILQKDTGDRTVEQVQEAVRRLRLASPIISWLAKEQRATGIAIVGPGTSSGGSLRHATTIEAGEGSGSGGTAQVYNVGVAYNLKRCRDRAQHLQGTLTTGEEHLAYDMGIARAAKTKREAEAAKIEAIRAERAEQQRKQREAQEAMLAEQARKAAELRKLLAQQNEQYINEQRERAELEAAAKAKKASKRKGKKPQRSQFEEQQPSSDEEDEAPAQYNEQDDGASDDGSDNDHKADTTARMKALFEGSDDDDDEDVIGAGASGGDAGSDAGSGAGAAGAAGAGAGDGDAAATAASDSGDAEDDAGAAGNGAEGDASARAAAPKRKRVVSDSDEDSSDDEQTAAAPAAEAEGASDADDTPKPSSPKRARTGDSDDDDEDA